MVLVPGNNWMCGPIDDRQGVYDGGGWVYGI